MTPREREAFDAMLGALLEVEFGNAAMEDTCRMCGRIRKTGHLDCCRVVRAIALAQEPVRLGRAELEIAARAAIAGEGTMKRDYIPESD